MAKAYDQAGEGSAAIGPTAVVDLMPRGSNTADTVDQRLSQLGQVCAGFGAFAGSNRGTGDLWVMSRPILVLAVSLRMSNKVQGFRLTASLPGSMQSPSRRVPPGSVSR